MKKLLLFLLTLHAASGMADDFLQNWKSSAGQAQAPPQLEIIEGPGGTKAVKATVVSQGKFQGLEYGIPTENQLTLNECESLKIAVFWHPVPFHGPDCMVTLVLDGKIRVNSNVKLKHDQWFELILPLGRDTLRIPPGTDFADLAKMKITRILLWPHADLDSPGESLAAAEPVFLKRSTESSRLSPVITGCTPAPENNTDPKILIDGKTDKQLTFPMFGDPEITFDFGRETLISGLEVEAFGDPQINMAGVEIAVSADGAKFRPVASLANPDAQLSGEQKQLIAGDSLTLIGRYFKLTVRRPRHDVITRIAEIRWTGRSPSTEDYRLAAQSSYDLGPAMPPENQQDYLIKRDAEGNGFAVNRRNGIAVGIRRNGETILERAVPFIRVEDGKNTVEADAYSDEVLSVNPLQDGIKTVVRNAKLPGIKLSRTYRFAENRFEIMTEFELPEKRSPAFILAGHSAVMAKAVRDGGVYETGCVSHFMLRKFADEVPVTFAADNYPVLGFENATKNLSLFQSVINSDGEFVPLDTQIDNGAKLTEFTPNGWQIVDMIFDSTRRSHSVTSQLLIADGTALEAYRQYRSQPEFQKYYGWIRRSDTLKQARCETALQRTEFDRFDNYNKLLRDGLLLNSVMNDVNFSWGDFPVSGDVRDTQGGRMDAAELLKELQQKKAAYPRLRLGFYTWLWSVLSSSDFYKQHPDWTVDKDQKGNPISFYPIGSSNPYLRIGTPEVLDHTARKMLDLLNYYQEDVWYLDGGTGHVYRDWKRMTVTDPGAWHRLYRKVREEGQKHNPELVVFFNTPYQPMADIGFLENSGDIFSNWRVAATWFYKMKLFQIDDPYHSPSFIYWRPTANELFPAYLAMLGSFPSFCHKTLTPAEVPYVSAQHESRLTELVNADIRPDWRRDAETDLESFTVKQGASIYAMLRSHAARPQKYEVSMAAPEAGKQYYSLFAELRRYTDAEGKGRLGESEREKIYRESGFMEDVFFQLHSIGEAAVNDGRFVLEKELAPLAPCQWVVSESNSFIYSIDMLPLQLPRDKTLGQEVFGRLASPDTIEVAIRSNRQLEWLTILPENMQAESITADGQILPFRTIFIGNRAAVIAAGTGTAIIKLKTAPANAQVRSLKATVQGDLLKLDFEASGELHMLLLRNLQIVYAGKPVPQLKLPRGLRGGNYTVEFRQADGTLAASTQIMLRESPPELKLTKRTDSPMHREYRPVNAAGGGFELTAELNDWTNDSYSVKFTPEKAEFDFGTLPALPWVYHSGAAGYELKCGRYLELSLSGNFDYFNEHGITKHHARYFTLPGYAIALMFDFHTPAGWTTRSLGGIGRLVPEYRPGAHRFDKEKPPADGNMMILSNFAYAPVSKERLVIDLQSLGAPADWDGKLRLTAVLDHLHPDRRLNVRIEKSMSQLPPGTSAVKPLDLLEIFKKTKAVKLPRAEAPLTIDGAANEPVWQKAELLSGFSRLNQPLSRSSQQTAARFAYDEQFLYVFLECGETEKEIDPPSKKQGSGIFESDSMEFVIKHATQEDLCYHVIFAPNNENIYCSYEALVNRGTASREAPPPRRKAQITPGKGWTAEFAVPLTALGLSGNPAGKALSFNVMRNRYSASGTEYLTLVPGKSYFDFERYTLNF